MSNFILYVLYYDDITKLKAEKMYGNFQWAKLVFNNTTKYVESGFILDILENREDEWKEKDYVGTISWKAYEKIEIGDFENINQARENNIDLVYLCYTETHFENIIENTDKSHPLFSKIWSKTLEKMGCTDIFSKTAIWFYCNYWMTTPKIMKQYIEFGKRVRDIIESTPEIKVLCEKNAMYAPIPPDTYKLATGKKYYMYHPFIMERIPCYFAYINNLKIRHYKRILDFPQINEIQTDNKNLIIYTYTGKEANLRQFLESKHNSDCYYVFNTPPPSDVSVEHSITRSRKGVYEGWSDVILNIRRDKYDYFIFVTDTNEIDLFRVENWDSLLILQITDDNHFLQFDSSNFIVDKIGLYTIDGIVFHPIIEVNDDTFAMDKTRKAISIAGYYPEYMLSAQLVVPKTLFSFNQTWDRYTTIRDYEVSEPFLELSKHSRDIIGYYYIHKEGGVFSSIPQVEIPNSEYDVLIGLKDGITNSIIVSKSYTDFLKFFLTVILKIIGLKRPLPIEYISGNGILRLYTVWYVGKGDIDKSSVISIYGEDIFTHIYTSFSSKIGFIAF